MNLYESKDLTTFTGMQWKAAIEKLKEHLESNAYTKVGGTGADLTDIDPAYLIEVVTEVFGPVGIGWRYGWPDDALDLHPAEIGKQGKMGWQAVITRFDLRLLILNGDSQRWSEPIPSVGGSLNTKPEDALKGAITRALGIGFSRLCWQIDVYKGLVSHDGSKKNGPEAKAKAEAAKAEAAKAETAKAQKFAEDAKAKKEAERPYDPQRLRELLKARAVVNRGTKVTKNTRGQLAGVMNRITATKEADNVRRGVIFYLFQQPSINDIDHSEIIALREWLKPVKEDGGETNANPMSAKEFLLVTEAEGYFPIEPKPPEDRDPDEDEKDAEHG